MPRSIQQMNVSNSVIWSRDSTVVDRSETVVVLLRLKEWHVRQHDHSTTQDVEIIASAGAPREWRFLSPDLNAFLLPRLSRTLVERMLSRLPFVVDSETCEEWIGRIMSSFEATARRALTVPGWARIFGDVEVDRFVEEGEEDVIDGVLTLSEQTSYRDGNFGGVPAAESSIDKLETRRYEGEGSNGGASVVGEDTCVVCYQGFNPQEEVTKMPCKHVFHGLCITQWLGRSHTCPICRFEMPKKTIE